MDRRRRQWVPIDVDLLSGDGRTVFERFGPTGVLAWIGFLTACAKASTAGRMTWRTEAEALVLMGMDGYPLVDNLGETFTIAEFFAWTGRHRWTATTRRRHGGDTAVTRARRWDDWQPRRRRAAPTASKPQVKPQKRGADRAQVGRKRGADRAELGRTPHLTSPSPTYEVEVGEEKVTAREPAGSTASRPTGPHATEHDAEPNPPTGNGVLSAEAAALLVDAGLRSPPPPSGPDPRAADPEAEIARVRAEFEAQGLFDGRGPVDLPAGEPEPAEDEPALDRVVPASFHDELQRVKGGGGAELDEPGQVAEGGGP